MRGAAATAPLPMADVRRWQPLLCAQRPNAVQRVRRRVPQRGLLGGEGHVRESSLPHVCDIGNVRCPRLPVARGQRKRQLRGPELCAAAVRYVRCRCMPQPAVHGVEQRTVRAGGWRVVGCHGDVRGLHERRGLPVADIEPDVHVQHDDDELQRDALRSDPQRECLPPAAVPHGERGVRSRVPSGLRDLREHGTVRRVHGPVHEVRIDGRPVLGLVVPVVACELPVSAGDAVPLWQRGMRCVQRDVQRDVQCAAGAVLGLLVRGGPLAVPLPERDAVPLRGEEQRVHGRRVHVRTAVSLNGAVCVLDRRVRGWPGVVPLQHDDPVPLRGGRELLRESCPVPVQERQRAVPDGAVLLRKQLQRRGGLLAQGAGDVW